MNVVVFFEAIIDRAVVFQIWIVWIDVLFRNIGLVEDIRYHPVSESVRSYSSRIALS